MIKVHFRWNTDTLIHSGEIILESDILGKDYVPDGLKNKLRSKLLALKDSEKEIISKAEFFEKGVKLSVLISSSMWERIRPIINQAIAEFFRNELESEAYFLN